MWPWWHEGILAPPGEYDWTCASLAHQSSQPKWQIDWFSHFCTADGSKCLYWTMGAPFPKNCPYTWGIWTPSNTWFLGPIWAHNPNRISIGSAVFAQMTAECPYTPQWDALPRSKLLLPMGDLDPDLIHGFLDPPESLTQTASRLLQPFL